MELLAFLIEHYYDSNIIKDTIDMSSYGLIKFKSLWCPLLPTDICTRLCTHFEDHRANVYSLKRKKKTRHLVYVYS